MQTYLSRRNRFGDLCNNSATATLALADTLMNASEKRIISMKDWRFLWRQYTLTTTAGTFRYVLPAYTNKPQSVYVTVGSYKYSPIEVTNRLDWDGLTQVSITSDIVTYYFVYDGGIELFPTPASTGNTITFNGRRVAKDLTLADYTTGTIVSIANGASAVVGSGTTWTAQMAGRWIQITDSNTANTGDGYWYEIASVASATTLTLVRKYGGTSISAGSAGYTIGQVSLIPEPHDMLPVYDALKIYYTSVDPDQKKAVLYASLVKDAYDNMVRDVGGKINVVVDTGVERPITNPNLTISL